MESTSIAAATTSRVSSLSIPSLKYRQNNSLNIRRGSNLGSPLEDQTKAISLRCVRAQQSASKDGPAATLSPANDYENALKVKEWELGRFQEELAANEGITIRRRPPTGPPLHYVGTFEFHLQNDEDNTPHNILEEIIWTKDVEVSQFKEKKPLSELKKALGDAPPTRDFIGALKASHLRTGFPALIAEVKKASPSRGVFREDFDPVKIAQAYEKGGAACLSVLTDSKFFQGSFENLKKIRSAGVKCPLLCKEFVIDAWQIYYARTKGADAILLIASVLPDLELKYMTKICKILGLAALIEVHNEREMDRVLAIDGIELIGINNRNLETFEVDNSNTKKLLEGERGELIREKGIIVVGESGLFTPDDIAYVQEAGVKAVLVGESIVKQNDPGKGIAGLFENEKLTVKYDDFPEDEYDDVFNPGDFKSMKAIGDFKNKFRVTSVQLQDHECSKVIEGMTVCAAYTFADTADIKFYDAVIDSVIGKEHTFSMGEEVCTCTFVVFWDHGSMAGSKTPIHVQDICLLQPGNVLSNSALASFLKMSKRKFELASHNSSVVSEDDCLVCGASNCCCGVSTTKYKSKSTHSKPRVCHVEDTNISKGLVGMPQTFKGGSHNHFEEIEQDIDMGAQPIPTDNLRETRNSCFLLIENLEKDISPSNIVSFMYKHTSITSQAYVFPSLSSEAYTRGIIVVDSHAKLQKLSNFLHNPAQVVMSSRGRPWVIPEKELIHGHGTFGESFGSSQPIPGVDFGSSRPWDNNEKLGVKIKVVRRGTREFSKGKQLIKLYMELSEHLHRLHKRLNLEEEKIWSSSRA